MFNLLKSSGDYIYIYIYYIYIYIHTHNQFNIKKFHVLPTQYIYVFCMDLKINSNYFPIQH